MEAHRTNLQLFASLLPAGWQTPPARKPGLTDVLLCVCDHFEPFHATDKAGALVRMAMWKQHYAEQVRSFRDADGCSPKHTFFYPVEQYDRAVINELVEVCRRSGSETEVHLHHSNDNSDNLRQTLLEAKQRLAGHGLLSRDASGEIRYGFIHGDWALDNSSPDGSCCGVSDELTVLGDTGCFADFTMPSAPDPSQTRIINQIYYATDTPSPKSHDTGHPVRVLGPGDKRTGTARGELLLVQGPLALNWERRKLGLLPRLENSDLTLANPPRPDRMRLWLRRGIHVHGRPEWVFIKLHTHGANPPNLRMLLGEPMQAFHQHLAESYNCERGYRLHYVTARELVNILHAAEDGHSGNPGDYRDYRYRSLLSGA